MDFLTQPEIKMQTVIFCSGNTLYGELGLKGIEDDHVFKLTPLTHFVHSNIVEDIASGLNHTVVLLQNGQVFTCGNNDSGQLGRENSHRKLELVESLAVHSIRRIACGVRFSVVLSDAGQLFSWGDNSHGELGLSIEDENVAIPRIIRGLALKQVVQVSCGASHCLALTSDGELYSWGDNSFSQLGLGTTTSEKQPRCITSLIGLPILQIASGGNHSFALTLSGALFGWGKNEFGQLGLSDTVDRKLPSLQKTLRSQHVTFVCCGDNHTAVLTKDGGVFTFGAGMYGQLGHGSKTNELLPRKVLDLMGNTVTQVACGRCHTLAYVPSKKRLHSFGLGGSGQLCVGVTPTNYYSPVLVALPWVNSSVASFEQPGRKNDDILVCDYDGNLKHHSEERYNFNDSFSTPMEVDDGDFNEDLEHHEHSEESKLDYVGREKLGKTINFNIEVYKIICGGDRSFVIAGHYDPSIENCVESYADFRELPQGCHIVTLRNDILKEVMVIPSSDCVPQDLMSYIETTFSSSACLNGSFLKGNGTHFCCSAENHGIDMSTASLCFRYIFDAKNSSIANVVGDCLEAMFSNLQPPMDIEGLRLYLFLPLCHLFQNPEKYLGSVIYPFLRTLVELPTEMTTVIGLWWIEIGILHFKNLVTILKNTILFIIKDDANRFEQESRILTFHTALQKKQLLSALDVLNALQSLNSRKKELLPYQDFYIPEITEIIDIRQDYLTWLFAPPDQRSRFILLCDYPFIFDSNAKSLILKADSHVQMQTAMDIAYRQTITSSFLPIVQPSAPLLVLRVSRDHIVANTIEQLSHQQSTDLKKPLHVVFWGEDAVDAGGVKKEFFLLLSKAILDPKYGMFIEYHETHCIWFHPQTFEEDVMYYLIGIVCGLAIYNSIIIDLPFPLVLYKKLLKEEVKVDDLKGLSPSIFRSLTSLLQYDDDDVEEVFILNFEISLEIFGENMTFDLKPNGKNIPVTKENKEEYVNLYVDFVLNKSVQVPFEAFARGFYKVCNSKILELFHAQELMTLVVGNEAYDWVVFEKNTEYKNGYTRDHEAIKMFWRVFHSLDLSDKRKFLLFLTGSDRIPILGMKEIKVFMQPMNVNDDHLPVAHTCFNILDLPYYSSEEILRTKLCQAIQHTEGFGLA